MGHFGTNGTPEASPLESDLLYGCSCAAAELPSWGDAVS